MRELYIYTTNVRIIKQLKIEKNLAQDKFKLSKESNAKQQKKVISCR